MPPSSTMRKRPKRERTRTTTRTCLRREARKEGCESESFSADSVSAVDDVEDSGVSMARARVRWRGGGGLGDGEEDDPAKEKPR